ncbi:MAG: T9SS type A sorting domain-containing protein [Saprospiraceae bacterium]|nr:T9SS type A sorting domain-containing protein [Saprospiraceae bacterium]
MVGYGEGVYYFNNELNKWEDINKDLPLSKRGEDIAISGNKIFVDVFPVQFDNTSFIYSLNISDKISSLTDGSANSDKIKVFPNPSSSTLNITLSSQNIDAIFYIYDSDFRLIKNFKSDNSNFIPLDISSFKQGTYLIQTVLNQKSYYNTFVKI